MIESAMVRDGKIPPSLWIFRAKNYLGMRDVQQIEAVAPSSGDIPKNSDEIVATLPEAPEENVLEIDEKKEKEKTGA